LKNALSFADLRTQCRLLRRILNRFRNNPEKIIRLIFATLPDVSGIAA